MILAHITDLHVRPRGLAAMRVCETNMLTERALDAVRRLLPRPDALVISGDLVANGLAEEYDNLADMLARLIDFPVYVIPGNHDDRAVLKHRLAHLPRIGGLDGFIQYAVDDLPVRLVMLDTNIPGSPAGELCAARLDWLETTLAAEPHKPTIVVMHHPSFPCGLTHMDAIILAEPERFTAVIARHPQVRLVLSGHHHRQITSHVAHAIGIVGPGVAHVVELDLFGSAEPSWNLEPAAFLLHAWVEGAGIVTHTAQVERAPGPYPFRPD